MGEAKRRREHTRNDAPTTEERAAALGSDPFRVAYDAVFGMAERLWTEAGCVPHQLLGLEFEGGNLRQVHVLRIDRPEDVPLRRAQMLERWPMVAHVCEAWGAPDLSHPPSLHPRRQEIVAIMLNTEEFMAAAQCEVNPADRTIKRAELRMIDRAEGKMGRSIHKPQWVS